MAAIKSTDIASFLESSGARIDAYLVHGGEAGQVAEIAKTIASSLSELSRPPGEIIRLSDQDLAQTPGRLASEARSLPMFGGRPVVAVKHGLQLTPSLFEELFDGPSLAAFIVVEAGNLKKDAKIRQVFEKARNAAAVACYAADARSLRQLIRDEVRDAGLAIAPDALDRLTHLLGGDWAVSRSEIAKLTLYAHGDPEITLAHVEAVVGDASAHAFDAAIAETMTGNAAAALSQLDGLAASGTPASVFLTLLLGHMQKLHAVLAAMERGDSFDAAVGRLRPPPHFRQKDAMKAQAGRWALADIIVVIAAAQETMRQTRLKPGLDHELVSEFMVRLSVRLKKRAA